LKKRGFHPEATTTGRYSSVVTAAARATAEARLARNWLRGLPRSIRLEESTSHSAAVPTAYDITGIV
jgi:hypothetical protein